MKTNIKIIGILSFMLSSTMMAFSQATIHPGGTFNAHHTTSYSIIGHLHNKGVHDHQSTSNIMFKGSSLQEYSSTNTVTFHNVTMKNSAGVEIDGVIEVDNLFKFQSGQISLNTTLVNPNSKIIFLDGATVGTGANAPDNNSFANCPVQKIGDDAFTFPVGDSNLYRPLQMTAPGDVNDAFTVEYHRKNPTTDGFDITLKEASIHNVSSLGYYDVDRDQGTSDVTLSLYYDAIEYTSLTSACDLVVAHWNGSLWQNLGNGGAASNFVSNGNGTGGTCGSPTLVTSFSPFALASLNSGTILPVELINFTAVSENNQVQLTWSTASEINNDYFIVERSKDAQNWDFLLEKDAIGTSTQIQNYIDYDERPEIGNNFYRLKQYDLDGTETITAIRQVDFSRLNNNAIVVYPNPAKNYITVEVKNGNLNSLTVLNLVGKDVTNELPFIESSDNHAVLSLNQIAPGTYIIKTDKGNVKFTKN